MLNPTSTTRWRSHYIWERTTFYLDLSLVHYALRRSAIAVGNHKLPLILEPQPEGCYTITCPILPNLITEADTLEEVMPNVSDALSAIIEAYQDLNQPLPSILQSTR